MKTVFSLLLTIILIVVVVILIMMLIFKKKMMFIITSILSISLIVLMIVINLSSNRKFYNIGIVDMKHNNHLEDVSLKADVNNYLYDNINQTKVEFKDSFGSYQPVYLRTMDHYLLLVFSTNNKVYQDSLFFQSDYQYYDNIDQLVIIDKTNGAKVLIREYQNIGKTFALDLAKDYPNSVIIPVLMPHSLDVSYLSLNIITEHFNDRGFERYLEISPAVIHFDDGVLENYSYVKDYIYDQHNNLFQIDNLGKVTYSINSFTFDGYSIHSSTTYGSEIFADLLYVKEGYYKNYLNEIYFLDNDLKIIKLKDKEQIVVESLTSINEWDLYFTSLS